jgi:hypothetical protein
MRKVPFFLIAILTCFLLLDSRLGFTVATLAQDERAVNANKSNEKERIEQQIGTDNNVATETSNGVFSPNVTVELSTDDANGFPITTPSDTASYTFTDPNSPTAQKLVREFSFTALTDVSTFDASVVSVIDSGQVSVSGRVMNSDGRPVPRARLTMTTNTGAVFNEMTNFSGYYRFTRIPSGSDYVFNVSDKRYDFATRIISIRGDLEGLDFMALAKNQ